MVKNLFWYQHYVKGEIDYKDSLHPVAEIHSTRQLWDYYQHFKKPSELSSPSNLFLFKDGIKPEWEDAANCQGGALIIRFHKSKSDMIWENLLLQFNEANEFIR